MSVLLINKFLHVTGGAETVLFQQWRMLEEAGERVIPYAMAHPQNVATPYARYFPPQVDYAQGGGVRTAVDLLWSRAAQAGLTALLADMAPAARPVVAHLHNVYHQLTPSVLVPLRTYGIPAVMTLHDYKLVCPNYRLYTADAPCQRCVRGALWHAVQHRCVKDSYAKSAVCMVEGYLHRWLGAYAGLARVLSPSRFLRDLLVAAGWDPARVTWVPNAVAAAAAPRAAAEDQGYVLYLGRLVPEKGVRTLLAAAAQVPGLRLVVAGAGPLRAEGEAWAARAGLAVRWLGALAPADTVAWVRGARCVVLPAQWPENAPLAVLEALAQGVPVVTTPLGGLPELVTDDVNGALVPPGEPEALAATLARVCAAPALAARWGEAGWVRARAEWGLAQWRARLWAVYAELGVTLAPLMLE